MRILWVILMLSISLTVLAEDEVFVTTRMLTASTANQIAVAAEEHCKKKGYQVSVAVVDRYGNLLAFVRNPLSGAHTIGVAQDKAYTSASFQGATIELANQLEFLKGTPRVSLVGGGVPVRVGGYMYGAVGISGAPREKVPGDVDDECARAGIDAAKDALEFAG
ncbi:GlcG/HbpS family heme-binding protein [Kaarinaea lacus]